MDIAALSTAMANERLQTSISMSMVKKVMNQQQEASQALLDGIQKANQASAPVSFGHKLDTRA